MEGGREGGREGGGEGGVRKTNKNKNLSLHLIFVGMCLAVCKVCIRHLPALYIGKIQLGIKKKLKSVSHHCKLHHPLHTTAHTAGHWTVAHCIVEWKKREMKRH